VRRILQHLRSQSSRHGSWYIGAEHASQHLYAIEDGVPPGGPSLQGEAVGSWQGAVAAIALRHVWLERLCRQAAATGPATSALARGPTLRSTFSPAATDPIA
jgi:hypothetical protein